MRIVLLITVLESCFLGVLMVWWRFRTMKTPALLPLPKPVAVNSFESGIASTDAISKARWGFINGWSVAPQAQDRIQAHGLVDASAETGSGRRSSARRKHQAMYKEWSRARHD